MRSLFALTVWLMALGASGAAAAATTLEMQVDGLVCAFCAQGIEKNLRKQAATQDVFVNLEQGLVAVALKDRQDIPDDTLRAMLTDAGYTLRGIRRVNEDLAAVRARARKK